MKMNSNETTQAIVKNFSNMSKLLGTLFLSIALFSAGTQESLANESSDKASTAKGKSEGSGDEDRAKARKYENEYLKDKDRQTTCKEGEKEYKKALEEINSGCSKAGYKVNECKTRALECMTSEGVSDDIDPIGMAASQMGVPIGRVMSGKACPQLSGKSFATRKDKIEEKLQRAQEQLADIKKDEANLQKEYNDDMTALNRKMREAEAELKKNALQMEAEDRKRFAEFQESQNRAKEELRKLGMALIQLRAKLNNAQAEKAVALIELNEEAAKMECDAKVAAVSAKATAAKTNTSQNLIAQSTANKKRRIAVWNACIEGFQEKRKAMLEGKKSEQEAIINEIDSTKIRADEIQNMLNLSQSQLDEIKKADLTAKNEAQQNLIKLGQEIQNEMTAAYTKLQQTQQSLSMKSASLQTKINMANMDLQKLMAKGEPPEETESSITQAGNTIETSARAIFDIESNAEYESCPFMQAKNGKLSNIQKTSKELAPFRKAGAAQ